MIGRRLSLWAAVTIATAVLGASLAGAPMAFAESPWWHVLSVSRPTNLHAGLASNEVQEITVSPETAFALIVCKEGEAKPCGEPELVGSFATEPFAAEKGLPEPTAANIQTAAEGVYGAGNVIVTEREAGSKRLVVESVGEDAFAKVRELETLVLATGPGGGVRAQLVTEGRPDGTIVVMAENVGDADVNGSKNPVVITDAMPHGLNAVGISAHVPKGASDNTFIPLKCDTATLSCQFSENLPPFSEIELDIPVVVEAHVTTGEENVATITGGEAPPASSGHQVAISEERAPFGVEHYELVNEEVGGTLDLQAGSHPFQQTTVVALNTSSATVRSAEASALAKDLSFRWPAGMIGDPTPFPACTLAQFFTKTCPAASMVGVGTSVIDEPAIAGIADVYAPLFNVEPAIGEPARFAFLPAGQPVSIGAAVRTGEDYGITVRVENIPQALQFLSSAVTVWGVPGATSHDAARGEGCLLEARGMTREEVIGQNVAPCQSLGESDSPAFLTLPSACTGSLETTVQGDSWREPKPGGEPTLATAKLPPLDGCNRLPFTPSIKVTPDGSAASTATGLTVDEHVPQESTLAATGLAESDVKGLSVTLPEGVAINPSAGDGLLACSEAQIGLQSAAASSCPEASNVATVKVKTPVLAYPLEGAAYIATQNENPFGSLMAMYIYAEDRISGVRIKSAGEVRVNPTTGQLTAHFERDPVFARSAETSQFLPQAPFEDVEVHFFGGERAPLATPTRCGTYTTTGTFVPWAAQSFDEVAVTASASSTFDVTTGPHGTPCPGARLPFAPTLTGGMTNVNAGAFSPLTTTIGREDGEQSLGAVTVHMPEGVEGLLSTVKLCPEARANEGTCGPESEIGETTVSAGVGSDPVSVKGGRVYITEAYEGAPFGLSIVNPVKAGPFDLEHDTANPANDPPCDCIVVRAKIEVNHATGELTATTNQSGPHAIPHIIDGIPVQIKRVNVTINRPRFTFNPTSCDPLAMTGMIESDEGAADPVSVPFQASNCALLKFTPRITVSTGAHGSKANGAGLVFKISYPTNAMGSQSWLDEAKFEIPKQLPARLSTLQRACLAATFETNRPACPAASIIGHAVVHTPVLPVPLEGPVYFVSYGGAKFPAVVLVLKGYGVTIEQRGETFISKQSVTSATFRAIPDVPFQSLEVTIPTGPFSEFGVNLPAKDHYDFCGQSLVMPTHFKASNGLEITQNTPVGITGCPSRTQKLQAALKACRRHKGRSQRTRCEKAARKRYGR